MPRCCARPGTTPSASPSSSPGWSAPRRVTTAAESARRWCAGTPTSTTCATLARHGLPIVAEPRLSSRTRIGSAASLEQFLARHAERRTGGEARRRRRLARHAPPRARARCRRSSRTCARCSAARRSVLLQPYLPSVDRDGETALIYIDGRLQPRHPQGTLAAAPAPAATAGTVCARGDHRRAPPGADELAVGARILAGTALRDRCCTRAIDLIRGAHGEPAAAGAGTHRAVAVSSPRGRLRRAARCAATLRAARALAAPTSRPRYVR